MLLSRVYGKKTVHKYLGCASDLITVFNCHKPSAFAFISKVPGIAKYGYGYVQSGAVKLVLWCHWIHLNFMHQVMLETQFYCTRLYWWYVKSIRNLKVPRCKIFHIVETGTHERSPTVKSNSQKHGLVHATFSARNLSLTLFVIWPAWSLSLCYTKCGRAWYIVGGLFSLEIPD